MKKVSLTKIFFLVATLCCSILVQAQQVGVNTENPDSSSILDIVSNGHGILLPRLSDFERDAIVNPAEGLMVFCTSRNCLNIYNGTHWNEICGSDAPSGFQCGDTFIDPRDGQAYPTVQIGTQCWLAKNLNYSVSGAIAGTGVYSPDSVGLFYNWTTAMQGYPATNGIPGTTQGVCPPGWHLPTRDEFTTLNTIIGNNGNSLKAIGEGVAPYGQGTNTTGFTAYLTGYYYVGTFASNNSSTYLWSSTMGTTSSRAWARTLASSVADFVESDTFQPISYCVRCIRNY